MKLILSVFIVAMVLSPLSARGEMFKAKRVDALDGKVKCLWARDRLITTISGPCENYTPPQHIRIGETFQANGKAKTIKVIIADRVEKDLPSLALKAGDWTCTAADSESNLPGLSGKREHTGTWLYIAKCRPVE